MNDFQSIKKLLPRALANYKLTRQARAALICQHFRELAPKIMGEDAKSVRPKYFKGGTLYVAVPSSAFAQRVYVHRHDIIMKLNLCMEKEAVHEIRTLVESHS